MGAPTSLCARRGAGHHVFQGAAPQGCLDLAAQGAPKRMRRTASIGGAPLQPKQTGANVRVAFDTFDDLQQRDCLRRARQQEAATETPFGLDQAVMHQLVDDLGQIRLLETCACCHIADQAGLGLRSSNATQGVDGVASRLRIMQHGFRKAPSSPAVNRPSPSPGEPVHPVADVAFTPSGQDARAPWIAAILAASRIRRLTLLLPIAAAPRDRAHRPTAPRSACQRSSVSGPACH